MNESAITVTATIRLPVDRVWTCWTQPEHITGWNFAADTWCCPSAENDLRPGGRFSYRMEAKNGEFGFDLYGIYDEVIHQKKILYTLGDNRKVEVLFSVTDDGVIIKETFEAENTNPPEMQRAGWQCILDNFKKYSENQEKK